MNTTICLTLTSSGNKKIIKNDRKRWTKISKWEIVVERINKFEKEWIKVMYESS